MGLLTYIQLAAGDRHIPVLTAYSVHCYTSTVHTSSTSPHDSPLALDSLLESPLQSVLESLLESLIKRLFGSLHERAMLDNGMH